MAQITLDISEYDLLRESKKQLEKQLEREQELNKRIIELEKEKTKALEDAKLKVVKITKTEVYKRVFVRSLDGDVYHKVKTFFGLKNHDHGVGITQFLTRLIPVLYEESESRTYPQVETTMHGFDEVRKEIREEYMKSLSEQTVKDLERIPNLEEEFMRLNKRLKEEEAFNSTFTDKLKDYEDLALKFEEKELMLRYVSEFLTDFNLTVSSSKFFINKIRELKKLYKALNEDLQNIKTN